MFQKTWAYVRSWFVSTPKAPYQWRSLTTCDRCDLDKPGGWESHVCPPGWTFYFCPECDKDEAACDKVMKEVLEEYWRKRRVRINTP